MTLVTTKGECATTIKNLSEGGVMLTGGVSLAAGENGQLRIEGIATAAPFLTLASDGARIRLKFDFHHDTQQEAKFIAGFRSLTTCLGTLPNVA